MIWELVPSIWVLKASGIGVWELGSSSFRFFFCELGLVHYLAC